MRADDSSRDSGALDARLPDICAAGAQIEAAPFRQRDLIASGRLATPSAGLPSATLPGYTRLRELHRGGQGVVYLAIQESTGRHVAIKLVHSRPLPGRGATGLARFRREIEVLSRLKHPNIVTVHDCGQDQDHVFLVMDYVRGVPLDEYVASQFPISDFRIPIRRRGATEPRNRIGNRQSSPVVRPHLRWRQRRPLTWRHPSRPEAGQYPGGRAG